jgi:hypothetical protein
MNITEQIRIIWVRPYQVTDDGDILPEKIRASESQNCENFHEASLLLDKLMIQVRDHVNGKE